MLQYEGWTNKRDIGSQYLRKGPVGVHVDNKLRFNVQAEVAANKGK